MTTPMLALGMAGLSEWGVVLLALVLLFGASRIPEIARALGRAIAEFKKGRDEGRDDARGPGDDAGKPR